MRRPFVRRALVGALTVSVSAAGWLAVDVTSASASVPLPALVQLEKAPDDNGGTPTNLCADASYKSVLLTGCAVAKVHNWAPEIIGATTVKLHAGNNAPRCLTVEAGAPAVGACDSASVWTIERSSRTDKAFALRASSGKYLVAGGAQSLPTLGTTGTNWVAGPPASNSHYVRNIRPGADNASVLKAEGCTDGTSDASASPSQPHVVLLHIGAQTITAPLSAANPGVALTAVSPTVRLSYPELVAALNGYLDGYVQCHSGVGVTTVAVATNNDGAWDGPYTPTQRGTDWAAKVVMPLRAHLAALPVAAGTSKPVVAGGFDVEAGFASTEEQAETWTSQYLAHTSADLVTVGSLDSCPQYYPASDACAPVTDDNGVEKTWSLANYIALNHTLGAGRIKVLPEVYYVSQARQWTVLDQQSVAGGKGHLSFIGVLTEYAANADTVGSNQASTAFSALLPDGYPNPIDVATALTSDE